MKYLKINILLVVFTLLLSRAAAAEIYYVSKLGDNRASGLDLKTPFKTIGYAVKNALPGDTVIVGEGIYKQISVLRSGVQDKPITFRGAATTQRPRLQNGINIGSNSWIVIEKFDIPPGKGSGVTIKNGNNNIVRNFTVEGHWRGVNIDSGNNNLIEDFSVTGTREGVYIYNNSSNNIVRRCSVTQNGNAPEYISGDRHGIAVGGVGINTGNLVEQCEVANNGGVGHSPAMIAMYAPKTIFRNNNVHNNYGDGVMISIGSEYSVVEANRIHKNGKQAVINGERGVRALAIVGTEHVKVIDNILTENFVSRGSRWNQSDKKHVGVFDIRQAGPKEVNLKTNIIVGNVFSGNSGGADILIAE